MCDDLFICCAAFYLALPLLRKVDLVEVGYDLTEASVEGRICPGSVRHVEETICIVQRAWKDPS